MRLFVAKALILPLLSVGLLPWVGWAQATVLWQAQNVLSPTMVPPYAGQGSPFPAPVVVVAVESSDQSNTRQLREQALAQANTALGRRDALQLAVNALDVRGVTQGQLGQRLLISNLWVGLNETLPVTYRPAAEVTTALEALKALDAGAAAELEQKLQARRSKFEKEGVRIEGVDLKERKIRLATPQGVQEYPLNIVTY